MRSYAAGVRNMVPILLTQTIVMLQDTSRGLRFLSLPTSSGLRHIDRQSRRPANRALYVRRGWSILVICSRRAPLADRLPIESMPLIKLKNVSKWYGQIPGPRRIARRVSPRATRGGVRSIGIGQDHADQMRQRARTVPAEAPSRSMAPPSATPKTNLSKLRSASAWCSST